MVQIALDNHKVCESSGIAPRGWQVEILLTDRCFFARGLLPVGPSTVRELTGSPSPSANSTNWQTGSSSYQLPPDIWGVCSPLFAE